MTQALPHAAVNGSRLVRLLTDLAVSDVELSHKHFARRLGQMIDLSDSISLSSAQLRIATLDFEPSGGAGQAIREDFLQARTTIVQSVMNSFFPNGGYTRIKLPKMDGQAPSDEAASFEPYQRFYGAQQREIDFRVQGLQERTRNALAGISRELAQLSALDKAIGETLSAHSRRIFALVPGLLRARFEFLTEEYAQGSAEYRQNPDQWTTLLEQFHAEMRALLLAEIEARLLPVLGLIEALDEGKKQIKI